MNIVVCTKQVVDTEARVQLSASGKGIARDGIKYIISPFDEFALEEAMRLKESHGGTLTAITLGPERASEILRTCLAIGADNAVHVNDAGALGADSLAIADILAAAVRKQEHDLVMVGKKAVGTDRGQVGAQLAMLLGYPFVSQVVEIEAAADGKTLKVRREVEGGSELFELQLPAVISSEKGPHELRHASLKGIMMAKKKPITTYTLADLGVGQITPQVRVVKMEYPPARTAGRMVSGEPAAAVKELVRLLHEEAKVI